MEGKSLRISVPRKGDTRPNMEFDKVSDCTRLHKKMITGASQGELRERLTSEQYQVTQEHHTERLKQQTKCKNMCLFISDSFLTSTTDTKRLGSTLALSVILHTSSQQQSKMVKGRWWNNKSYRKLLWNFKVSSWLLVNRMAYPQFEQNWKLKQ